jgi:hypothetical protein
VALVLALAVLLTRRDVAFCLVVVWALVGILSKQGDYEEVVLAAEAAVAVILIAVVVVVVFSKFKR